MARALSDRTVDGTPVTAGAQSGFDIDLGSLLDGNSVRITYTDNADRHAAHASRWCGSTIRTRCRCRIRRPTDPNDQVIGLDFSGGMASVVSQLDAGARRDRAAVLQSGRQRRCASSTTARANRVNVDAVSATTTVTVADRRERRAAVLPRRQRALYRRDHVGRARRRSASPAASRSMPASSPTRRGWSSSRPRR